MCYRNTNFHNDDIYTHQRSIAVTNTNMEKMQRYAIKKIWLMLRDRTSKNNTESDKNNERLPYQLCKVLY